VEFFETSRGGDVTYHGPGQIVAYPILNLAAIRRDVVWYVRMLEEAMIRATAEFGISGEREGGKTGIWVKAGGKELLRSPGRARGPHGGDTPEKLGAIGVHISRWVTSHGLAYNVSTDLRNFELIVPCGIAGRKTTSLEKLLGRRIELDEVKPKLAKHLGEVFALEVREIARPELIEKLEAAEQPVAATA
jgi:lipoyl(octanoyl) transferase